MAAHSVAKLISGLSAPMLILRNSISGFGRVAGTIKIKGTPDLAVRRRVRLIREIDSVCVGETWSDAASGAYEFVGVDPTVKYTVVAYDGPRVYRASIQDNVSPTAWP